MRAPAPVVGSGPRLRGRVERRRLLRTGDGPELFFKRMQKSPTIELPIHLDVNVADREAEVDRIIALGAKLVETKTSEAGALKETFTVLRDRRETRSACKGLTRAGRIRTSAT